jgi:hypothetical protein
MGSSSSKVDTSVGPQYYEGGRLYYYPIPDKRTKKEYRKASKKANKRKRKEEHDAGTIATTLIVEEGEEGLARIVR